MIDQKLIKQCIHGDRKAQYELYKHCYALLMPIGMRYLKDKNEASSAVNMTMIKVMDKRKKWKEGIPFDAWTSRIYINHVIDELRKRKAPHQEIENVDLQVVAKNTIEEQIDVREIELLIDQLPEFQRTVFQLFAIDGFAHQEISKMLDITEGNSRYHLHTARTKLKEMIYSKKHLNLI